MKLQFGDELVKPQTSQRGTPVLPLDNSRQVNQSPTITIPVQAETQNNTQFPDEPIDIPAIGDGDIKPEIPIPLQSPELSQNIQNKTEEEKTSEPINFDTEEEKEEVKTVAKVGVSKFFMIGLVTIAILSSLSYALILTPLGMYVGLIPDNSATTTTVYSHSPSDTNFKFGVTTVPAPEESSTELTRDAQRKRNLGEIKAALDAYYLANNNYPIGSEEEKISNGSGTGLKLLPTYIESIPGDPRNESEFSYLYKSDDGTAFELKARLENGEDPAGKSENGLIYYLLTNN